jgi:L-threonylcarbamoyladenylate synthase
MEVLKVNQKNFKEVITEVIEYIKKGKVIICPTDTVYGLITDATNKKAVDKIFKIKKRPRNKPIPIFVSDFKMAKSLANIDKNQERFLKSFWPGKTTIILRPKRKFPKGIGKPKKEIGLRIPNYKFVTQLLKFCNHPLTGTSANISGKPASTKIKEVLKQFTLRRGSGQEKYQPDLVISAGNLPKSKPSKVIDLTVSSPKILRF